MQDHNTPRKPWPNREKAQGALPLDPGFFPFCEDGRHRLAESEVGCDSHNDWYQKKAPVSVYAGGIPVSANFLCHPSRASQQRLIMKHLTQPACETSAADMDTSQCQEGLMNVGAAFVTHPESAILMQPIERAFNDPADTTRSLALALAAPQYAVQDGPRPVGLGPV